ncbi:hypothetical protein MHO82_25485 [Vibrio sp. Of7-15]|uniref:hypothetical protein n=1 Tax=Vibrio sp. Of7-15 TaxID=2724879 RepID=UPI001EF1918D|nr:hypothetical protein [Vibrio sp. Of7-15]MCG7500205.1 hypothetical protein [Vibrio sp. Of7-15]
MIQSKMREGVLYTEEENDDYCSDEFHEAIERRKLELPFYSGGYSTGSLYSMQ